MGGLMSKPKLERIRFSDKNENIMYGYCAMQGWRIEMEDTHTTVLNMDYPFNKWSFFGVFDGHNGDNVSIKCSTNLLSSIIKTPEFQHMKFDDYGNPQNIENLQIGIRRGFMHFDEYLRTFPEVFSGNDKSGSTAICVFITPRYIVFINCGDSRGILIRDSISYFNTNDHKPSNPEESARIIKAGGSVIADRVNGCLALSRSLGDFIYKKSLKNSQFEQLVSADPTISVFERVENDQMVVLCCDGVWDVLSNSEVCDFLLSRISRVNNLGKVAEELVNLSFYKGSKDNISALIINLKNYMVIDEEMSVEDVILDKRIKDSVREYYNANGHGPIVELHQWMESVDLPNLPPGGLAAKQYIVEDEFHRLKSLELSHCTETPTSLRQKNALNIISNL